MLGLRGLPSPCIQNAGGRADFWGSGFSSPHLQNAGGRADCWGSGDSPLPTYTECWRKGRLLGSRAGCRGSHHPTCRVRLGRGQARLRWQWASPSGLGGLWPCSENWSNLFASTGFFAGVGGGGVYLSGHLQQQFAVYQKCQPIKGNKKAITGSRDWLSSRGGARRWRPSWDWAKEPPCAQGLEPAGIAVVAPGRTDRAVAILGALLRCPGLCPMPCGLAPWMLSPRVPSGPLVAIEGALVTGTTPPGEGHTYSCDPLCTGSP